MHYKGGFMPNFKSGRLAEDIKRELSALTRELKDPRISNGLITIIRCEISGDLSHCKVYVSDMNGYEKSKEAVKGFESASGYIKRHISNTFKLKRCPEFSFIADKSGEYSQQINKMLKDINEKAKEEKSDEQE